MDLKNLASKATFMQLQINYQLIKLTLQAETWKALESHEKNKVRDIASLRINLSLNTVHLSPPMFGQFCKKFSILFFP